MQVGVELGTAAGKSWALGGSVEKTIKDRRSSASMPSARS